MDEKVEKTDVVETGKMDDVSEKNDTTEPAQIVDTADKNESIDSVQMDDVTDKFDITDISKESHEEKSSYENLYKYKGKTGSQDERRKELLDIQKGERNKKLDSFRGILDLVQFNNDEYNIFRSYGRYRPKKYVPGFHRSIPDYRNVLMLSEWLVEKPEDFHENWLVVPCPKGVRMLVVASQGRTKFYSKYGHFRYECRTLLPGGNPCDRNGRNWHDCCVLDGVYYYKANTLYILDLLAWNSQPMIDGEAEFRHYWMEMKFDFNRLQEINKKNEVVFKLLPKVPCTPESFDEFMSKYPQFEDNLPRLDGLLFYHKLGHYVAGETPLVGWLFPYMVKEVLGADIKVHHTYATTKPEGYECQAAFIEKFEAKKPKWKKERLSHDYDMDYDEEEEEDYTPNVVDSSTQTEDVIEMAEMGPESMEAEVTATEKCDQENVMESESKVTKSAENLTTTEIRQENVMEAETTNTESTTE